MPPIGIPSVSYLLLSDGAAENEHSRAAISRAEARFPGIVPAIRPAEGILAACRHGRPLSTGYLDFGSALWVDLGLHESLRKCLEALLEDSELGAAMREFFDVNQPPDADGNRLIRSAVHPAATIRNSIVIDSSIRNADSAIEKGVVVGCNVGTLRMPAGGACLFSRGEILEFAGPGAIAFRVAADAVVLQAGERRTTIPLPGRRPRCLIVRDGAKIRFVGHGCADLRESHFLHRGGTSDGAMHPQELEAAWSRTLTRAE